MSRSFRDYPGNDAQYWTACTADEIAILRFQRQFALGSVQLQHSLRLWQFLEELIKSPHRMLLVSYPHDGLSHQAFVGLWDALAETAAHEFRARAAMLRTEHAMRRWISYLRNNRLFTVGAWSGEVDISFLGLLLACDYRVAAEDSVIVNSGNPHDVRQGTAVPWFLARTIGRDLALQCLLDAGTMNARRAMELGIVHRITPADAHEQEAVRITESLAGRGVGHLLAVKHAIAASELPLDEYFCSEGAGFDRWPGIPIGDPVCETCGYNLTGNVSGRCPECGTVIELEIRKRYGLVPRSGDDALH